MKEIKDLIKEIKSTRKDAETVYDDVPYKARASWGIKIRRAQDALPTLVEELKQAVIPSKLVAVFGAGSKKVMQEVSSFLQDNGGITIDASSLYESVSDAVEATYGTRRTFGVTQFVAMMNELRQIASNLGCEVVQPDFNGNMEVVCKDKTATTTHVREIIKKFISDELNRKFLTKIIIDAVLSGSVDAKQVPVLVTGVQSLEDKAPLTSLFSTTIDYKFPTDFIVTKPNIVKLFKNPAKGNDAENRDE